MASSTAYSGSVMRLILSASKHIIYIYFVYGMRNGEHNGIFFNLYNSREMIDYKEHNYGEV